MTLYWLPYTCGAIVLSACSLWLLRHSSLMGSSDLDSWIGHAKEKPIRSVGAKPFESFKGTDRPLMDKQEVGQTEKYLQSSVMEQDQVVKANILDLQEAILELGPVFEAMKLNFALLALGLPLLLLLRARARAVHVQRTEGRRRIACHLIVAEQRLLEFQECNVRGKDREARWKFGLALYSLDRLYQAVDLYPNAKYTWSTRWKEHIFYLAKPGREKKDQLACSFTSQGYV